MNRRRFLAVTTVTSGVLAGCSGRLRESPSSADSTGADRDTIVVAPEGSDSNPGTRDQPLETIQFAIDRAQPGDTVALEPGVHTSGEPDQPVGMTKRAGDPDEPITITGPPEAVVRGPPVDSSSQPIFLINHSHVHLEGMTLDGLTVPDADGDSTRYRNQIVGCSPPTWQDSHPDYLTDVWIKPRAVGNARTKLINAWRTNDLEIGGFEVIGPAGVDYVDGDADGSALGAVVSLGRSSNNFDTSHYPWDGPDESHGIHVHHIANLDGHEHTELVKLHAGNHDITIEYCTDRGGNSRSGVFLPGAQTTVRWCELTNGERAGVSVYVPPMKENGSFEQFDQLPPDRHPGTNNAIYGNHLLDNEGPAIAFSSPEWFNGGPNQQRDLCGNEIDRMSPGAPDQPCPSSLPTGEGIGHTGGDSPWK